ncbi:fibrinogen C domain-containing protein 1-like [Mytilus edulis]|uniref:fibrinogen C domain-containing protein 1-like n=1 Tax=Mytilus edulis TaxID=6550 RepID=UPI0039EF85A2
MKNRKFIVENNQAFVSTDSAIRTGKVVSPTACASLCTSEDECCTASYNKSTQECHLNSCCFLDTRPSENEIIIRKVAKPNMNDIKTKPIDCGDLCQGSRDGIYRIFPKRTNEGIDVYCEIEDGWTVIQRRADDSEDFTTRNWSEYKHGFGILSANFWLGDAMRYDNNMQFSTFDRRSSNTCRGGWWYGVNRCDRVILNGLYSNLFWDKKLYISPLKSVSMKIKRP